MAGATIHITCGKTGKQAYTNLIRADRACQRLIEQTGRAHRIYRCEFCSLFHLTSQRHRYLDGDEDRCDE
jgi:hypothetical protein